MLRSDEKSYLASVKSLWSGLFGFLAILGIVGLQVGLIFYAYTLNGEPSASFPSPPAPSWSAWVPVNECSASCGEGVRLSLRSCLGGTGELECAGQAWSLETCNRQECPINGQWGCWQSTATCSASCGSGTRIEQRTCNNPTPSSDGETCQGEDTRSVDCTLPDCPLTVDGGWSEWMAIGQCSKSCGSNGMQVQHRSCNNPLPQHGGNPCQGEETRSVHCPLAACQVSVDGSWSPWQVDVVCTSQCGHGLEVRSRHCNHPAPSHGGMYCSGEAVQLLPCTGDNCEDWSPWVNVTSCSATCGHGVVEQERSCQSESAANCIGSTSRNITCNLQACPIDGNWSAWSAVSNCSEQCGGGERLEQRSCTQPAPAHGGLECVGEMTRSVPCNTQVCNPIDGGWSEWIVESECPVSCGGGERREERSCDNPTAQHGGMPCEGESTRSVNCNNQSCLSTSQLVPADESTSCYTTGEASYACAFPFLHEGLEMSNCVLDEASNSAMCPVQVYTQTLEPVESAWRVCDTSVCPLAGGWSQWTAIHLCSASCNGGFQTVRRSCLNPPPLNGGSECEGETETITTCNERACPSQPCMTVGGNLPNQLCLLPFTDAQGEHHDSCVQGQAQSWCPVEQLSPDGNYIDGLWGYCDPIHCPVQGGWALFPTFDLCPCGTADNSSFIFTATCNNPPPTNGGSGCPGQPPMKVVLCSPDECLKSDCGGVLEGVNGTFSSPGYPNGYDNFQYCVWNITVDEGERIHLVFNTFDLETDYDFVYLFNTDVGSPVLTGDGSAVNPLGFFSLDNTMLVIFESDYSVNSDGFRAAYSLV